MDWRWELGNSMAPTKADGNQQSKASQGKNKYNTVMHITKKLCVQNSFYKIMVYV